MQSSQCIAYARPSLFILLLCWCVTHLIVPCTVYMCRLPHNIHLVAHLLLSHHPSVYFLCYQQVDGYSDVLYSNTSCLLSRTGGKVFWYILHCLMSLRGDSSLVVFGGDSPPPRSCDVHTGQLLNDFLRWGGREGRLL